MFLIKPKKPNFMLTSHILKTVHVFIQSIRGWRPDSCGHSHSWAELSWQSGGGPACSRQGGMADLWPCLTAHALVLLLCNKLNWAIITLQTTGCNYTFKSWCLVVERWMWLKGNMQKSKSQKTNHFLMLFSKAWLYYCMLFLKEEKEASHTGEKLL